MTISERLPSNSNDNGSRSVVLSEANNKISQLLLK